MTRDPREQSHVDEARPRSPWSLVVFALCGVLVWVSAPSARAFAPEAEGAPTSDELAPEPVDASVPAGVADLDAEDGASAPAAARAEEQAEQAAQEEHAEESRLRFLPTEPPTFPVPYSQRPLNMPRFYARAGGTLRVYHFDDATRALTNHDTSVSLTIGGSFAVTDWLEFGVLDERLGMYHPVISPDVLPRGLFALALTPNVKFGDIPVHARVRLVASQFFDASMDLGVVIPVTGDLQIFGDMVVRARPSKRFAIDSGLEAVLSFERENRGAHLDLFVPFSALIQLHPSVFLAVRTGVRWVDFDHLAFPLGAELGYTVASGDRPLMDILLGFGFPAIVTPNDSDKTHPDAWQMTLSGHAYFSL